MISPLTGDTRWSSQSHQRNGPNANHQTRGSDDRDQSQRNAGCAGSKTQTRWGGLKESSPKVAPWRAAVAYACEEQWDGEPITDPVEMQITFLLPGEASLEQSQGQRGPVGAASAPLHCTSSLLPIWTSWPT